MKTRFVISSLWAFRFNAGLLAFIGCFAFSGCESGGGFCTLDYRSGINIYVTDAETGLPAACGTEAWLISGEYYEDISDQWGCSSADSSEVKFLDGAGERAGIYTAVILKDGYAPWVQNGIRVTEDNCHVRTVDVDAELVPLEESSGFAQAVFQKLAAELKVGWILEGEN